MFITTASGCTRLPISILTRSNAIHFPQRLFRGFAIPVFLSYFIENHDASDNCKEVVEIGPAKKCAGDKKSNQAEPKHVSILKDGLIIVEGRKFLDPRGCSEAEEHQPQV